MLNKLKLKLIFLEDEQKRVDRRELIILKNLEKYLKN